MGTAGPYDLPVNGGDLDGLPKGGLGSLKVAKGCKDKLKDPSAPPRFLQNDVPA